ncbi:MAG: beta-lactamase family protein [Planctomycetes bacterium]|nr:beta-lactamase family protein [Planctomycetota bacterium]
MIREMQDRGAVGAAVAVTRFGRLVYTRGFGYADLETSEPVQPTSLFRIGSMSKPITAVAVLQLVQRRKLALDATITDVVKLQPVLEPGGEPDPRMRQVTIRHLLNHSGGWDRDETFDPMTSETRKKAAKSAGVAADDVRPEHIVCYMLGQPLDFDPGTKYAYSNFGYCVLGRVIESVSGQSYEGYVKKHVLAPLGIRDMHIGTTTPQANEVMYYKPRSQDGEPQRGEYVSANTAAGPIDVYESMGGWIASVIDLAKFASAFDVPNRCRILSSQAVDAMFSRPIGPPGLDANGQPKPKYYAFGWNVSYGSAGPTIYHVGGLRSSTGAIFRRPDGLNWVVVFNVPKREDKTSVTAVLQKTADGVRGPRF